jgi:dihydroflavonol-4-reductase
LNVFVTGGNGFIGSAVVQRLVQSGHQVRCLIRPSSRCERIAALAVECVPGDVRDLASLRSGMAGCQAVIHLAGLSSWDEINSPLLREVVEGGTRNVLQAAMDARTRRVIFVSSVTAVNGSDHPEIFDESSEFTLNDPELTYALAKHSAEAECRIWMARGLPVVIVNPAEVYGPSDTALVTACNLISFARSNPIFVCSGGTSIVHVDDVASGIVSALGKGRPGERYILGGENLTIRQLAHLFLELANVRRRILTLPNWLIRQVTRASEILRFSLPYHTGVIPYATRYWFVDASKARRELDVQFRDARATLMPTIAWLKQEGHIA